MANAKRARVSVPASPASLAAAPMLPAENMGSVQTLPQFLAAAGQLTLDEERLIVDQALIMIQDLYVHLPLKRAMHAIDPVQSLRLLQRQLATAAAPMKERLFHNQMIGIFVSLRDLHTNYVLPEYFASYVAFLPFYIEEFYDDQTGDSCHYVVSKLIAGFNDDNFKPGAVLKYWNGIPIDHAVELNAERNAGSNPDARHARGLENMTIRPMAMSLPPDEEWVIIGYEAGGQPREIKIPWQIYKPDAQSGVAVAPSGTGAARHGIGMDFLTETVRRTKVKLFAPAISDRVRKLSADRTYGSVGASGADAGTTSNMPDILAFRTVTAPGGDFGYLRIYSFAPPDDSEDALEFVNKFFAEVIRILGLLPQNGLILDVRGNGGGIIMAGEKLLQLFTPNYITPERFDFVDSPLTRQLTNQYDFLKPWASSINRSVETGATYSQGFPLTEDADANAQGQVYQGPVALITNALIYSTTDIFSAGFQDHGIGPVLGTAGNTGAGGANVWDYSYVQEALPEVFKPLPKGVSMRVALRRSLRGGAMAGMPLEDLGVIPDALHRPTSNDVFNNNADLIAKAVSLIKDLKPRVLTGVADFSGGQRKVTLQTLNLTRVDIYLDDRPAASLDVTDGSRVVDLPPQPAAITRISLDGFDGAATVASRRIWLA